MIQKFVVISLFEQQGAFGAELGPKDPNISRSAVAETLKRWGVKPTLVRDRDLDPMWYLTLEDKPIGYVRVFEDERWARFWFENLRDRNDVWAYWRNGHPLALIEGADIKDGNQFVASMAICRVRALSDHSAAERGWKNWISGQSTAIEIYVRPLLETGTPPRTSASHATEMGNPTDRWEALVRYDDEIRAAAESLRPFGESWVNKLGQAFFALNEDRKYLPNIVRRLTEEAEREQEGAKREQERLAEDAERERERRWAYLFRHTADGKPCTEESLNILREAETRGYVLGVARDKSFTVTKNGTTFLRSNGDIKRFGQYLKRR